MRTYYQAYLLRLSRSQEQTDWRATLENAHTGECLHFPNEREMLRYLLKVLTVEPPAVQDKADIDLFS
jgi:hypothetical protein